MPPLALSPLSGPPQAVVLEGNYWKRRIEVVMREYHKWRIYYKKRVSGGPFPLRLLTTASLARAPEGFPPTQPRPCPPLRPRPTAPPSGHTASSQPPYLPGPKSFRGEVRDPVDLGELVSTGGLGGERWRSGKGSSVHLCVFLQLRKSSREGDLLAPKQVGAPWTQRMDASLWVGEAVAVGRGWDVSGVGVAAVLWLIN